MNTAKSINYQPKINNIQFPLFKFLMSNYAEKMLNDGEIRLSNLYSFKSNNFGGLIDDSTEGEVNIINHYDEYNGLAEDVECLILLMLGKGYKNLKNITLQNDLKTPDALIYCTTAYLFSDSLSWAIEEGKESCIMITDSDAFFSLIHQHIKDRYKYYRYGSCFYIKTDDGYFHEDNADKSSLTNHIIHDPFFEFLLKPKKFVSQIEVRAIFRKEINNGNNNYQECMPEIISIPQLKEYLLEVKFLNIDKDILFKHKQGRIKMTIVLKSGEKNYVLFKEPFGVLTPVIFKIHSENCSYVGFCADPSVHTFEGGLSISDIPLYGSSIGSIHGGTKLESVSHIEICTEPIT